MAKKVYSLFILKCPKHLFETTIHINRTRHKYTGIYKTKYPTKTKNLSKVS